MKKDMTAALRTTLRAEEKATDNRFERAEAMFGAEPVKAKIKPEAEGSRVIRDSFTIPSGEYEQIAQLRERCLKGGLVASKSELLRAGLAALAEMPESELLRMLRSLPRVKTGRPTHTV